MENKSFSNDKKSAASTRPSALQIIWDRTKNSLLFVIVSLFAAFALIGFLSAKENFDKEKNKPWLIVHSDETPIMMQEREKTTRPKKIGDLAGYIIHGEKQKSDAPDDCKPKPVETPTDSNKQTETSEQEKTKSESTALEVEAVCNSVEDIKYTNFKNADELINALMVSFQARKASDLKTLTDRQEKSRRELNEIDEQKREGLKKLNAKLEGKADPLPRTVVEIIAKEFAPAKETTKPASGNTQNQPAERSSGDGILYAALSNLLAKNKDKTLDKAAIVDEAGVRFDSEKEKIQKTHTDTIASIKEREGPYRTYTKHIYDSKSEFPPAEQNILMTFVFDDTGKLNVIYYMISVTLTAIFVFALLYLILIPLKYLFFFSTSADVLSEQAKKFLERRGASAGTGALTRALITTVSVVGIGTAVVASNPFGGLAANKNQPEIDPTVQAYRPPKPSDVGKPSGGGPGKSDSDQKDINDLVEEMKEMTLLFGRLEGRIDNIKPEINNYKGDISQFNKAVKDLMDNKFGAVFGTQQQPQTVFGELYRVSKTLEDPKSGLKNLYGELQGVSTVIGSDKYDASKTSIFSDLNQVRTTTTGTSNAIGTQKYTNGRTVHDDLAEANTNVSNTSKALGTPNYLKEDISVFTSLNNVAKDTQDTGRSAMGTPGKNIFRQFQGLFSDQHYRVTDFTIEELRKVPAYADNPEYRKLVDALVHVKYMQMSADRLFKEVSAREAGITREMWKSYKDLILRFARVSRY